MKTLRFLALSLLLGLAACGSIPSFDLSGPITYNTLTATASTYGLTLTAMKQYRKRPLCLTGTVSTSIKPCARRSLLEKMRTANGVAVSAIQNAVTFVEENPKVDASNIIGAAIDAVKALRAVVDEAGVTVQ